MKPASTTVWITLLLLTFLGFFLSESTANTPWSSAILVMGIAGGKTILVTHGFMELGKAPKIWSMAILGLIAALLCMILVLA